MFHPARQVAVPGRSLLSPTASCCRSSRSSQGVALISMCGLGLGVLPEPLVRSYRTE